MGQENMGHESELMTPTEVAKWLRLSTRRVLELAKDGHLPSLSIPTGKRSTYRFEREEIERYMKNLSPVRTQTDSTPDA